MLVSLTAPHAQPKVLINCEAWGPAMGSWKHTPNCLSGGARLNLRL